MTLRGGSWAVGLVMGGVGRVGPGPGNPNQVAAKVERAVLHLTPPDRYRVTTVVEPLRKVAVMAPSDGVLRNLAVPVGSTVREGQEIARLDTNGALARSRSRGERQGDAGRIRRGEVGRRHHAVRPIAEARLDAAKARAELAQMEVDVLHAPRPVQRPGHGRDGQPRPVPVEGRRPSSRSTTCRASACSCRSIARRYRSAATSPSRSRGRASRGKVQAVLPLAESHAMLRELASPLAAAWVTVANPSGTLEPGQRAQSPYLPNAPIAGVASYSLLKDEEGNPIVQVIRAERVADVPVRVLGILGPDRTQVSGPFRASDVLIQTTSVPLRAGTFIRFNDAAPRGVEGHPPPADQVGDPAEVPPRRRPDRLRRPTPRPGQTPRPTAPAAPATTTPAANSVSPF